MLAGLCIERVLLKAGLEKNMKDVLLCKFSVKKRNPVSVKSAQLIGIVSSSSQAVKLSRLMTPCQMYEFLHKWMYWNIKKDSKKMASTMYLNATCHEVTSIHKGNLSR
jgi:hypothetical protein